MSQSQLSVYIAPPKRRWLSIALLLIYFGFRFGLDRQLDQLGAYSSYLFELGFVTLVAAYYRKRLKFSMPVVWRAVADAAIGLAFGFLVYKAASPLSLIIPFQLEDKETLLLLLLVAPVLEEALFRIALWEPLADLVPSSLFVMLATSLFFSFAHFFAWWSVPELLRGFVLYQSVYVFFLALYCGLRRSQTGSVMISIIIHFGFNLGFYFGFLA